MNCTRSLLSVSAAIALGALATAQQDDRAAAPARPGVRPIQPVVVTSVGGAKAQLWDNGPFITQTGVGAGGADVSEIETGLSLFGSNQNNAAGAAMADDFTVPAGETWNLTNLRWAGYQTGAPTTGTMTGAFVELYDGSPAGGGSSIAGDQTTNVLNGQVWTGVYRVSTNLLDTNRAIIEVDADLTFAPALGAGSFYVAGSLAGSLSSGPWAPPTVPWTSADNAEQFWGGAWNVTSGGQGSAPQACVFRLDGTVGGGGTGPGMAYCFGVGCPCGNDDPTAGCINSTGAGALMQGTGTSSVAADDLTLTGTSLPPTSVTLLIMGSQTAAKPIFDGKLCVGGQIWRLWKHQNSGQAGTVTFQGVVGLFNLSSPPIVIGAGETWNFQMWFRDSPGNQSTCGKKANFSNAYSVTFQP